MRGLAAALLSLLALTLAPAGAAQGGYPAEVALPPVHPSEVAYATRTLVEGLPTPVSVVPLGDGSGRLLVVGLGGRVWLLDAGLALRPEPFLDLAGRVTGLEGEQGLFSVALEPPERSAERGDGRRLVAAFTEKGTGDLVVASYPLADDLSGADASPERLLLRVPMPEPFHHGGQVAFGPDGMLYVSVGSGEAAVAHLHERPAKAQDLRTLLGKLLRVDPFAAPEAGAAYAVPPDNPFTASSDPVAAAAGARGEVWALGFRNPWKFTFAPGGELFLVDVGQDRWEEVNLVARGGNHGWPAREGAECHYLPDAPGLVEPDCPHLELVDPVVAYAHLALDPEGGQSVTGGVVVTDPGLPELLGRYVYGDFVTGRLWAYDPASGRVERLLDTGLPLTAVAAGEAGEVLLLGVNGVLARLERLP